MTIHFVRTKRENRLAGDRVAELEQRNTALVAEVARLTRINSALIDEEDESLRLTCQLTDETETLRERLSIAEGLLVQARAELAVMKRAEARRWDSEIYAGPHVQPGPITDPALVGREDITS